MSTLIQRSFTGGEIAPSLYARVDTVKYQTGLRTCRNFFVMRHGGAASRPGSQLVSEIKDSSKTVALIPFVFNADQTYVLEFGDLYMRVHRNGEVLKNAAQNITAITNASTGVLTYVGSDNYANGNHVYLSGIVGAIGTYLNGRIFKVAGVDTGANTFQLNYLDGTAVNTTSMGSYTSGGTVEEIYEITTNYAEADLAEIQYVQSADVITLVHPNYKPAELSRTGHTTWTLADITFAPEISPPTGLTHGAAIETVYTITGASSANPAVITTSGAHGYATNDEVQISSLRFSYQSVFGATYIQSIPIRKYKITVLSATTFSIKNMDGSNAKFTNAFGSGTYSSGGNVIRTYNATGSAVTFVSEWVVTAVAENTYEESEQSSATGSTAIPASGAGAITLSWTEASNAVSYNVYRKLNGVFGFIGSTGRASFSDDGIAPDTTATPPVEPTLFIHDDDYPSAVSYYQQRRLFANTNNHPETVYGSRTGQFKNHTISTPLQDDDAVQFTLAGRQVNEVRHMIDLGKLLVLTSGGEWVVEGDDAGILRPGEVNPKQQSYNGSSTIPPLVLGMNALYIQARGSIVRDIGFELVSDGYKGNDLTIFAAHLFDGFTIVNWTYQQIPHSIVWVVRSDGALLGLTYIQEHQVWGWHRHDFDGGTVENVCSVPEGNEDAVYVVVKRTIDGDTKRYVERLNSRFVDDVVDYVGMDSALTYDGRNTGSSTMTLSGGTDWTFDETLTLTASNPLFVDEATTAISGISQANPGVVTTSAAHGFVTGEVVYVSSVGGMTQVNGNYYKITVASATTFSLQTIAGSNVDTSGYTAYTSGGTIQRAKTFSSADVGNSIFLYLTDDDGEVTDTVRCSIAGYTSLLVVTVNPHKTVPAGLRSIATSVWTKAVDEVTGLWHLEGETVSVFADGFVVANPNNDSYNTVTITNGTATLDRPYGVIHVGKPITCDIETLDIDNANGESLASKKKLVTKVSMHVEKSRGIWVGAKPPTDDDDDPLEGLVEMKLRNDEGYDEPNDLQTGTVDVNIQTEWSSGGRIFVRQIDPIPLAVLSIVPDGMFPFNSGGR